MICNTNTTTIYMYRQRILVFFRNVRRYLLFFLPGILTLMLSNDSYVDTPKVVKEEAALWEKEMNQPDRLPSQVVSLLQSWTHAAALKPTTVQERIQAMSSSSFIKSNVVDMDIESGRPPTASD